jgi:hypothetical protein
MSPMLRRVLIYTVVLPLVCFSALYLFIWSRFSMRLHAPLGSQQQAAVLSWARQALSGQKTSAPSASYALSGPLWISVFDKGRRLLRIKGEGTTLGGALAGIERRLPQILAKTPVAHKLATARIKVDITLGQGRIVTSIPFLFAKSINPGLDGLGLQAAGKRAYLLPDDLFSLELLAGYRPFFFMHEFKTGLDIKAVVNLLASEIGLDRTEWRRTSKRYFRFRLQSFIERLPDRKPADVLRHRVMVRQIDRGLVERAVYRAADYVLRQMKPDGKFHYIYYPMRDQHQPDSEYNLPRHAGTTWFLSLATRHLKKPRYKKAARQAIEYLVANAVPPSCQKTPFACVGSEGYADLGSAGLATVAIVEYQQATGDKRFEGLARRLGEFMLSLQKPNGDFCHQYFPKKKKKDCDSILLYYAGEATLALAKLHQLTKDPRYVKPLERALDFLVDGKYRFFMGRFFISEDHWTCIAAEAAYEAIHKPQYLRFCRQFAQLNRRTQILEGDPLGDLRGAFGITPFFMPHNTPVGSRSEANVATYLLSKRVGKPDAAVLETVRSAMRYLVDQQLGPESGYWLPSAARASGALTQTPTRTQVRIDYVQHSAAAMVRALPLIPKTPWPRP